MLRIGVLGTRTAAEGRLRSPRERGEVNIATTVAPSASASGACQRDRPTAVFDINPAC
jgi:hypothetical protein